VSDLSKHRVLARKQTNTEHDYYDHYIAPNTAHYYEGNFAGVFDY
jgi:hypothetical protein